MSEVIPGLVSTVIPVYNRPAMLRNAVESVLRQSYRPIEVLIADDGSTDNTPAVASELCRVHPEVVFLYRNEKNRGSGPGPMRELGRIHARGEYLQYLDSDDYLMPDKFTDQVAALMSHPECDIAYGYTRLVDEAGIVLADPFKWTARDIPQLYPGLLVDRWWCTHTPLYRRSLTDRIGAWSSLRWSQDWEYDARAGALGTRLVNCHTYVSAHRHHHEARQTSAADWTRDPVRLRNRVELLTALWSNALIAGISAKGAERQHFARWSFTIARQCAAAGLTAESRVLLGLAEAAGDTPAAKRGFRTFRVLQTLLGSRAAGLILRFLEGRSRRASELTLPQSFSRTAQTTEHSINSRSKESGT